MSENGIELHNEALSDRGRLTERENESHGKEVENRRVEDRERDKPRRASQREQASKVSRACAAAACGTVPAPAVQACSQDRTSSLGLVQTFYLCEQVSMFRVRRSGTSRFRRKIDQMTV